MDRMTANYHTHTRRCGHASGEDREYVENAIASGIRTLGFSDHSPMIFTDGYYSGFRMPLDSVPGYFESLCALREEYRDRIRILIGAEVEYYPALFEGYLRYMRQCPLDYLILGQHFVWDEQTGIPSFRRTEDPEDLRQYYENVLEAVSTGRFLYVAHPDVLNYAGDEDVYLALTTDFLERLKPLGVPLELNRLGFFDGRHYPRRAFWELCGQMGIPAVLGLDAHSPDVLLDKKTVDRLAAFADGCGVRILPEPDVSAVSPFAGMD